MTSYVSSITWCSVPTPPLVIYPSGQFSFTRSYCPGFYVRHDGDTPVLDGNVLTFTIAGTPSAPHRFILFDYFPPWSSNHYTLDHVFYDGEYYWSPLDAWLPAPYIVGWDFLEGFVWPRITLNAFYGAKWSFVDLPSQPPGYWRDPPPPQPPLP